MRRRSPDVLVFGAKTGQEVMNNFYYCDVACTGISRAEEIAFQGTAAGIQASYLRNGENGLMVERGNAAKLAAAMARLLETAPLRERFGRKGRDEVTGLFTPAAIWRAHSELYANLTREGAAYDSHTQSQ